MPLSSTLFVTAGLAAMAAVTAPQDAVMDYQVATTAVVASGQDTAVQPQKLSVDFKDATASAVLDYLSTHGFNYVVSDKDVATQTLTLHIADEPIEDVAEAIAAGLGGHWDLKKGIHVFAKDGFMTLEAPTAKAWSMPGGLGGSGQSGNIEIFGNGKLAPGQKGALDKTLKIFGDGKVWSFGSGGSSDKVFAAPGQVWSFGNGNGKAWSFGNGDFGKAFSSDGKQFNFKFLNPGKGKAFVFGDGKLFNSKDLKGFGFGNDKTFTFKNFGDMKPGAHAFAFSGSPDMKFFTFGHSNTLDLIKSLTKEQKALQASRGYLKLSDLSAKQRESIGNPSGKFTLEIDVNGQKVKVKN